MAVNVSRVILTDNTELVRQATEDAIQRALERIGLFVEGEAKIELAKEPPRIDTGQLTGKHRGTIYTPRKQCWENSPKQRHR